MVSGTVKEMSAVPVEAPACTIMSTFTPASASWVNTLAAMPGSFGTPRSVASDSVRSCATPEMTGASGPRSGNRSPMDLLSFSFIGPPYPMVGCCQSMLGSVRGSTPSGTTNVPGRWEKELRTCSGIMNRCAYSTQRRASTLDPQDAISVIES